MNPSHLRVKASVVAMLFVFAPIASADRNTQHRVGITINVPFNGQGLKFNDAGLNLVYQKARLREGGKVTGYELMIGSTLSRFDPTGFVAGFAGNRCAYGATGLGFAKGTLAVPVMLHGPFSQIGLLNAGEFGTPVIGASSLGCFDKFSPEPTPTPTPTPTPSSGAALLSHMINDRMFASANASQGFDWS